LDNKMFLLPWWTAMSPLRWSSYRAPRSGSGCKTEIIHTIHERPAPVIAASIAVARGLKLDPVNSQNAALILAIAVS
jgi:hypothetical protein